MISGFELATTNDCTFLGSKYFRGYVSGTQRTFFNWAIPPATLISGFAGFLILSKEENRRQYPHKFIGMICLAQAMGFGFLNYFDADFCSLV